jgi:transketolase
MNVMFESNSLRISLTSHDFLSLIIASGDTSLSFTEDVAARFRAYGWHTLTVQNGDSDFDAIRAAYAEAKAFKGKPVLISVRYGH